MSHLPESFPFRPPSGINFRSTDDAPITSLTRCLQCVATFLQDLDPYARLIRFADWWQHDGQHFYVGDMGMHDLFLIVDSPESLLASMPGDDYVRVGVAPMDRAWYLRFYAEWTSDGWELTGSFDLTLPHPHADSFRERVATSLELSMTEENADDWYRSIIAAPSA